MSNIVIGMSGGVDSSVAALLLKQQGHDVTGVFMQNWDDSDDPHCHASEDLSDAKAVCDKLNIELKTINFQQAYWDHVFEDFLHHYRHGRTPNPDILCNKEIKFKAFLNYALNTLNADKIATGHYAQCHNLVNTNTHELHRGLDNNKDQSYFLYTLGQHALQHTIFPIGALEKPAVRQLAEKNQLVTADKKDSTGICFIGERKFKAFLQEYLLAQPGDIFTEDGVLVGQHDGLMYYTIGQRKGIQVGGVKSHAEQPWYVLRKNIKDNELVIGQGHDNPALFQVQLICESIHWISENTPDFPLECTAKVRYRQQDTACVISQQSEKIVVSFKQPQRAITPGQSVVFYQGSHCLGGGIIC